MQKRQLGYLSPSCLLLFCFLFFSEALPRYTDTDTASARPEGAVETVTDNPSVIADAMPAPLTQGSQWGALHKICLALTGREKL